LVKVKVVVGMGNSWRAMELYSLKRSWKHIQLQNGRRRSRALLQLLDTLLSL
jgi:hypothetical protein